MTYVISHKESVIPGEQVWVSHLRKSPYGKFKLLSFRRLHFHLLTQCFLYILHASWRNHSLFPDFPTSLSLFALVLLPECHFPDPLCCLIPLILPFPLRCNFLLEMLDLLSQLPHSTSHDGPKIPDSLSLPVPTFNPVNWNWNAF